MNYGVLKHNSLYLRLVPPSAGRQSLIRKYYTSQMKIDRDKRSSLFSVGGAKKKFDDNCDSFEELQTVQEFCLKHLGFQKYRIGKLTEHLYFQSRNLDSNKLFPKPGVDVIRQYFVRHLIKIS